jgi:Putative zinc-finger
MDCRAFRQLHGDWVDDVLDPRRGETVAAHIAECPGCARFDVLVRRALMVARNAPQHEVSPEFRARLMARIADERRARISVHAPSHAERGASSRSSSFVWARRAAAVVALVGGSAVVRSAMGRPERNAGGVVSLDTSGLLQTAGVMPLVPVAAAPDSARNEIVVLRSLHPVGGALLPRSEDPLLDGADNASIGDASVSSVAATAPLWQTAQMAAHAASRFHAMEFGDVTPVTMTQVRR